MGDRLRRRYAAEPSTSGNGHAARESEQEAGLLCQVIHFSHMIATKVYRDEPVDLDNLVLPTVVELDHSTLDSLISTTRLQVEAYQEMANLLS